MMKRGIYDLAEALKPVLLRIIPPDILRKIKNQLIHYRFTKTYNSITHTFEKEAFPDGINLIGSIRAGHGLGQSCRLVANELENSSVPVCIYDFVFSEDPVRLDDHSFDDKIKNQLEFNINLIHLNPSNFCYSYFRVDKSFWEKRYNIGFWLWELEEFPDNWKLAFKGLDEIWTPSEYISKNLRKITDLPVVTIPYCVTAPVDEKYDRAYFSLPEDKFLFLMMYDSNSMIERKNPLGVIEAFKKAFTKENHDVGLIIKVNNCNKEDISILKNNLSDYDNIYLLTNSLTKIQVNSLIKCADVLVSLHRAEGFGLVMAEAMIVGTPCIATNYSSNTEFMNSDVACMVGFKITEVKKKNPVYPVGAKWAEPDLEEASEYMRKLWKDKNYFQKVSRNAESYIKSKLSLQSAVTLIENRVNEIYAIERDK